MNKKIITIGVIAIIVILAGCRNIDFVTIDMLEGLWEVTEVHYSIAQSQSSLADFVVGDQVLISATQLITPGEKRENVEFSAETFVNYYKEGNVATGAQRYSSSFQLGYLPERDKIYVFEFRDKMTREVWSFEYINSDIIVWCDGAWFALLKRLKFDKLVE